MTTTFIGQLNTNCGPWPDGQSNEAVTERPGSTVPMVRRQHQVRLSPTGHAARRSQSAAAVSIASEEDLFAALHGVDLAEHRLDDGFAAGVAGSACLGA